jgi:hypothetical protein
MRVTGWVNPQQQGGWLYLGGMQVGNGKCSAYGWSETCWQDWVRAREDSSLLVEWRDASSPSSRLLIYLSLPPFPFVFACSQGKVLFLASYRIYTSTFQLLTYLLEFYSLVLSLYTHLYK